MSGVDELDFGDGSAGFDNCDWILNMHFKSNLVHFVYRCINPEFHQLPQTLLF